MLSINKEDVYKLAEQLAILHRTLRDASGLLVVADPFNKAGMGIYPSVVMSALVLLTGGEAIGYQGETHLKNVGGRVSGVSQESFTLEKAR